MISDDHILYSEPLIEEEVVTLDNEATDTVISFLTTNVPKSDVGNIGDELKKDFVLVKRKNKVQKKARILKKTHSLTRNEKKSLEFYEIPKDNLKYSDILPLNEIWSNYMNEILALNKPLPSCTTKGWENFTQTIYKSDFHGSILQVVRSKCPSFIGKKGIVIMDTKNTFKLISTDNVITTIIKRDCVFEMYLKNMSITLFGKHLCTKPAERSTKKVKSHLHPDL